MAIPELRPKQASSRLRPIHVPTHERRRDQVTPPPIADSPVLTRRDVVVYFVFLTAWTTFNALFWQWWFQADHIVNGMTFILATIGLSYDLTLMPAALLIFLPLMKRPDPISPSPGLRVAMLTAIVPSAESIDILEQTVAGMTAVRYPHDNWVLDEGGDSRVRELCLRYGVNYWSRSGISEFNQASWPFQTKTKSGNYNARFTRSATSATVSSFNLNIYHVPKPGYLDEVLGYFDDPDVAYVVLLAKRLSQSRRLDGARQFGAEPGLSRDHADGVLRLGQNPHDHWLARRVSSRASQANWWIRTLARRGSSRHVEAGSSRVSWRLRSQDPGRGTCPGQFVGLSGSRASVGLLDRSSPHEIRARKAVPGCEAAGYLPLLRAVVQHLFHVLTHCCFCFRSSL